MIFRFSNIILETYWQSQFIPFFTFESSLADWYTNLIKHMYLFNHVYSIWSHIEWTHVLNTCAVDWIRLRHTALFSLRIPVQTQLFICMPGANMREYVLLHNCIIITQKEKERERQRDALASRPTMQPTTPAEAGDNSAARRALCKQFFTVEFVCFVVRDCCVFLLGLRVHGMESSTMSAPAFVLCVCVAFCLQCEGGINEFLMLLYPCSRHIRGALLACCTSSCCVNGWNWIAENAFSRGICTGIVPTKCMVY